MVGLGGTSRADAHPVYPDGTAPPQGASGRRGRIPAPRCEAVPVAGRRSISPQSAQRKRREKTNTPKEAGKAGKETSRIQFLFFSSSWFPGFLRDRSSLLPSLCALRV